MVWSSSGEDPLTLGAAKRRARDAPAAAGSIDSSDVRQQVQHVLEQERALHRAHDVPLRLHDRLDQRGVDTEEPRNRFDIGIEWKWSHAASCSRVCAILDTAPVFRCAVDAL